MSKFAQKLWFLPTGSQHNQHVQMKFGVSAYSMCVLSMPNLAWISKRVREHFYKSPQNCKKNCQNCNILARFRPSDAIKYMPCCYTSICVDMIRDFAHAASFAAAQRCLLWPPCIADVDIIFLFCVVSSVYLLFISSPIISHRRLDVYHTSSHGVALVRIQDAGLKRATRRLLKIQDAKNRHKFAIWAPLHNFVGPYVCN